MIFLFWGTTHLEKPFLNTLKLSLKNPVCRNRLDRNLLRMGFFEVYHSMHYSNVELIHTTTDKKKTTTFSLGYQEIKNNSTSHF